MKIGKASSSITPEEREKVTELPTPPNTYLSIETAATAPATAEDGEVYYNSTDSEFYLREEGAWVEVLFSMEEIVP